MYAHWATPRPNPTTTSTAPTRVGTARHSLAGRQRCSRVWRRGVAEDQHRPHHRGARVRSGSLSHKLARIRDRGRIHAASLSETEPDTPVRSRLEKNTLPFGAGLRMPPPETRTNARTH